MPSLKRWQLVNKRITGYRFWHRRRAHVHLQPVLDQTIAYMQREQPNHIICTGDLTNLGTAQEVDRSTAFLRTLGAQEDISVVPGNHDAYTPFDVTRASREWAPWISEGTAQAKYPFVRELPFDDNAGSGIAIFKLNSAIATRPFNAQGRLGRGQLARLRTLFAQYENWFRIIMIHHPPISGTTSKNRELRDHIRVQNRLEQLSPHLITYGHNHRHQLTQLTCKKHVCPVIGVRSASASAHILDPEPSGFNLYEIERMNDKWHLTARFMTQDGAQSKAHEYATEEHWEY